MTIRDLITFDKPFNIPIRHKHPIERTLFSLQNDMNSIFDAFFQSNGFETMRGQTDAFFPAVNIIDNDKNFIIKAEIAGYDPDDIEVSVTDGFLSITGHYKEHDEEKHGNYIHKEMSYGSFKRTIGLPESANSDSAKASFKNGILSVDIQKKANAVHKPKKLAIKKEAA